MRLRLEVERARLAVAPHLLVIRRARAGRHRRVRHVRHRHEQAGALVLDLIELDLELPDLLRARLVRGEDVARVLALTLRACDLVAGRVLLPLQPFDFRDQAPPPRFERRELLEVGVRLQPAVLQRRADVVEVFADVGSIEHGLNPIPDPRRPEVRCGT